MIENSMLDSQICILPSNMTPNKSYYEKLGFKFEPHDQVSYKATLPNGWKIEKSNNDFTTDIIDESGIIRGNFYFIKSLRYQAGEMHLI